MSKSKNRKYTRCKISKSNIPNIYTYGSRRKYLQGKKIMASFFTDVIYGIKPKDFMCIRLHSRSLFPFSPSSSLCFFTLEKFLLTTLTKAKIGSIQERYLLLSSVALIQDVEKVFSTFLSSFLLSE